MSDTNMKFFAASIDEKIATIDLHHTTSVTEALDLLEHELYKLTQTDARYCKVIHGVGEGVLVREVHEYVKKHPLVSGCRLEESGGSSFLLL